MRLTAADRAVIVHALNLAIRDSAAGLDPEPVSADAKKLNGEILASIEKFRALRTKIQRHLTGKGE